MEKMNIVRAGALYASVEKRRLTLSARKGDRTCEEWEMIEQVYQCEKRLHAMFTEGERSVRLNEMFCQYKMMLVNPPKAQA
jgi:hypothetical protein